MDHKHEIYSWRKFLNGLYPTMPIFEERDQGAFARPSFRIEEASHVMEPTGGVLSGYVDNRTIQIVYFGESFNDVLAKESVIYEKLMREKVIQGWMENFAYPKPFLTVVTADPSSIGGKTIYVTTTGLIDGNESLGTEESIVVPGGTNGVLIRVNRFPLSYAWFPRYNIYVTDAVGTTLLHSTLNQPNGLWAEVTVSALGTGVVVPTQSEVKFRNILIKNMTTSRREDELVDGVWNGFFSINTQSLGFILHDQTGDTLKTVTIT